MKNASTTKKALIASGIGAAIAIILPRLRPAVFSIIANLRNKSQTMSEANLWGRVGNALNAASPYLSYLFSFISVFLTLYLFIRWTRNPAGRNRELGRAALWTLIVTVGIGIVSRMMTILYTAVLRSNITFDPNSNDSTEVLEILFHPASFINSLIAPLLLFILPMILLAAAAFKIRPDMHYFRKAALHLPNVMILSGALLAYVLFSIAHLFVQYNLITNTITPADYKMQSIFTMLMPIINTVVRFTALFCALRSVPESEPAGTAE